MAVQTSLSASALVLIQNHLFLAIFIAVILALGLVKLKAPRKSAVPVLSRHGGIFGIWKDSLEYVTQNASLLQDGYDKYSKHGKFYQLRTPTRWIVVAPPKFVEEIRLASPQFLSAKVADNDVVQTRYTVSPIVEWQKFHFDIVTTQLTPSLESKIADIRDEIGATFREEIGTLDEWKSFHMTPVAHRIATRVANRVLVGNPLCRDPEYLELSIKHSIDVFMGADKLRAWPEILKTPVSHFLTDIKKGQKTAKKLLVPHIKARLNEMQSYRTSGKHEEWMKTKPRDPLQWIIDAAPNEKELDPERLTLRLLHLNVAAVHTTSVTFLNCVYDLAFHPEVLDELRSEVEQVSASEGWTKQSLANMKKLDSAMQESQRLSPFATSEMTRAVLQDFQFSDGTIITKGSYVLAPMLPMYQDQEIFPDAWRFDAFRYSRMREQPGQGTKHQFVSTAPTRINFGHGKYACPGRFFAAQEIKLLLAHILLHYDIRMKDPSTYPTPLFYDRARIPNPEAHVEFKLRK